MTYRLRMATGLVSLASLAADQPFTCVVSAVDGSGQETQRGTTGTVNPATCP